MSDYIYLGDRLTDPSLKNKQCDAVRINGKCVRGRLGTMLVTFNGVPCNVIGRRLRKIKGDAGR